MTIIEAITRADEIARNAYSQKRKIEWLAEAEGLCHTEFLQTRDGYDFEHSGRWNGFPEDVSVDTKLVMPEPYDSAYVYYLESKIHYANEEFDLSNAAAAQYEVRYQAWKNEFINQFRAKSYGRFLF